MKKEESVYRVGSFCTDYRSYGEIDFNEEFSLTYEDALDLLTDDWEDYNYFITRFSIPKEEKLRLLEIVEDEVTSSSVKVVIDYDYNHIDKVFKTSRDAGEYEDETGIESEYIEVNYLGYIVPRFRPAMDMNKFINGNVVGDSVDDEKDKTKQTPEEFIKFFEGLFGN